MKGKIHFPLTTMHHIFSHYSHHMPVRLKESSKLQRSRLQFAAWSGNTTALIMIANNDIFLRQSPSDEEDIRLTYTGYPDIIYNGVPDWLYQEEIFPTAEAIWSSDDGTHIVYATFNDTNVGVMTFPWFSTGAVIAKDGISSGSSFPETRTLRYPTPGTLNPEVQLWVLDITNITDPQHYAVIPPSALDGQ